MYVQLWQINVSRFQRATNIDVPARILTLCIFNFSYTIYLFIYLFIKYMYICQFIYSFIQ